MGVLLWYVNPTLMIAVTAMCLQHVTAFRLQLCAQKYSNAPSTSGGFEEFYGVGLAYVIYCRHLHAARRRGSISGVTLR